MEDAPRDFRLREPTATTPSQSQQERGRWDMGDVPQDVRYKPPTRQRMYTDGWMPERGLEQPQRPQHRSCSRGRRGRGQQSKWRQNRPQGKIQGSTLKCTTARYPAPKESQPQPNPVETTDIGSLPDALAQEITPQYTVEIPPTTPPKEKQSRR